MPCSPPASASVLGPVKFSPSKAIRSEKGNLPGEHDKYQIADHSRVIGQIRLDPPKGRTVSDISSDYAQSDS